MAKPFKVLLWIFGAFLALIAVAALAVTMLFDPNDYKGRISGAVKDSTGREFAINGKIGLSLFPWLGVDVADIVMGNAEGFGPQPFMKVGSANVGIKLMPLLFARRVEVRKITVDGVELNLAKAKDGTTNWADFSKEEKKPEAEKPAPEPKGPPVALMVGGLDVQHVTVSYTDAQTGAAYKVADLSVQTGAVELNKPLDVTIAFLAHSAKPQLDSDVKIAFTALANVDTKVYELKDLKVDTTSKGPAVPGGSQTASIRAAMRYDGAQGAFALSDAVLEAAGLKLDAAIQGSELNGEAPKFSGKLSSNTFNPKELAKSFGAELPPTADPKALTAASFSANYSGDASNAKLDGIQLKLDQTTATGWATVRNFADPVIQFALKADQFDADRYMAPAAKETPKAGEGGKEDFKKIPIPVDALDAVNASGTFELGSLKASKLQFTNAKVTLDAPKGKVKTQEMSASLYGGKIAQSARITPGPTPHYDIKLGLDNVNSGGLEQDLIGKTLLSGLGNFKLDISSSGGTVGDVLKSLDGVVASGFRNGALEGFSLDHTLASAKALYAREPVPEATGPKRTPFSDLKGAGKITDGVLETETLDVKGEGFALGGDGKINLVDQTLDYVLAPTLSGEKYKDLQGLKLPIKVSGSWYAPKVKVDVAGALKGKVKEELKKEEVKAKEKAKSKLSDFLNKKLAPKPAPAPAPAPGTAPASGETAPAQPAPSQPAPAEQPKTESPPPQ